MFAPLLIVLLTVFTVNATSGFECPICTLAVGYVEEMIAANKSETEIMSFFDNDFCDKFLPPQYQTDCVNLVNTFLPDIISYVVNKEDAATICSKIGACASSDTTFEILPVSESETGSKIECEACDFVLSWVEQLIAKNTSVADIESFLTNDVCKLMPGAYKGTCDALVAAYTPEIIQYVINEENPNEFCAQVHLCSSSNAYGSEPIDQSGVNCPMCEYVFGWVESFVAQNKTEEEIEVEMDKVCSIIPKAYQSTCTEIINSYLPQIIASVEAEETPQVVCTQLGLCTSDDAVVAPPSPPVESDIECMMCEYLVGWIESKASNNKTEAEIEAEIEKDFCATVVPKAYEAACDGLVETYLPQLIEMVVTKETPEVACTQIKMCASAAASIPVVTTTDAPIQSDTECLLCEYIIGWIEKMAAENKTQAEIEAFLTNDVCKLAPASYRGTCDAIVQAYTPELLQYIESNESPSVACSQIGLCKSESVDNAVNEPVEGDIECMLCEYIIGWAEKMVAENKTIEEIENFLTNDVCKLAPSSYRSTCDALVQAYLPQIIAALENKESPDTLCSKIGLCKSMAVDEPVEGDIECMLCEYIIGWAEKMVAENKTIEEIENFLTNDVCKLAPSSYRSTCDALVQAYLPQIIAALENKESPDTICSKIGLCKSMSVEEPVEGDIECMLCEYIIGWAEKMVAENKTIEEIENFLTNDVCKLAPSSYRSTCDALVQAYLPQIIAALENKESPDTICTKIGLCTSSMTPKATREDQVNDLLAVSTSSDEECKFCTFLVSWIEKLISQQKTEQEIESFLVNDFCNKYVPKSYQGTCDAAIQSYLPELIQWVVTKEAPDVACAQVSACSSTVSYAQPPTEPAPEPAPAFNAQVDCELCQIAVREAHYMQSPRPTLRAVLRHACLTQTPEAYQQSCRQVVDSHLPALKSAIGARVTPSTSCDSVC